MLRRFLQNPILFIARQVYKILCVIPFTVAVSIYYARKKNNNNQSCEHDVCVIITSVIYPTKKELSYAKNRTVFTPAERIIQTERTIESIKRALPNACIVLIEGGLKPLDRQIYEKVDLWCYAGAQRIVNWACAHSNKSLGEAALLLYGYKKLPPAKYYLKISGRYELNKAFSKDRWVGHKGVRAFIERPDYMTTRLYGFDWTSKNSWERALFQSIPLLLIGYPIEYTMKKYLGKIVSSQESPIGVEGSDATTGKKIRE